MQGVAEMAAADLEEVGSEVGKVVDSVEGSEVGSEEEMAAGSGEVDLEVAE